VPLPDWLLWLLPVPLATLGAIAWVSWSSRTRGPQDPADSVREYERFRAAMSRPPKGERPPED
jgi:cytochrome c-type biogenesis protein CcmH/NrfF